jgi:MSHA biogenesis protein MshK
MIGALLAATPLAAAEALPDPTRPAIGADGAAAASEAPSGPRLQMIKISPARRSAIIDGQEVTVGGRVGDMRVVRISEGEVVLRGENETETLKLFADVDKRPLAAPGHPGKASGAKAHSPARKKTDASSSRKAQE